MEVQVQKGSPDIRKFMIAETACERPGADVDDGFATTESSSQKIQVKPQRGTRLSGMASSWRVRVTPGSKRLDQNSSRAVAKHIGEAQRSGIKQYNGRTEPELTESTGESGTNTAATTVTRSGQC